MHHPPPPGPQPRRHRHHHPCGGSTPLTRGAISVPVYHSEAPQAHARGRWRSPRLRSNLPKHDKIPIPDREMPQTDVSEAEPQKQAMWNGEQRHKSKGAKGGNVKRRTSRARISVCYHAAEILQRKSESAARTFPVSTYHLLNLSSGGNSAAEVHSINFNIDNLYTVESATIIIFRHLIYTIYSSWVSYAIIAIYHYANHYILEKLMIRIRSLELEGTIY